MNEPTYQPIPRSEQHYTLYPYAHRCWCGAGWTVTEDNRVSHEVEVAAHRVSHKKEVR